MSIAQTWVRTQSATNLMKPELIDVEPGTNLALFQTEGIGELSIDTVNVWPVAGKGALSIPPGVTVLGNIIDVDQLALYNIALTVIVPGAMDIGLRIYDKDNGHYDSATGYGTAGYQFLTIPAYNATKVQLYIKNQSSSPIVVDGFQLTVANSDWANPIYDPLNIEIAELSQEITDLNTDNLTGQTSWYYNFVLKFMGSSAYNIKFSLEDNTLTLIPYWQREMPIKSIVTNAGVSVLNTNYLGYFNEGFPIRFDGDLPPELNMDDFYYASLINASDFKITDADGKPVIFSKDYPAINLNAYLLPFNIDASLYVSITGDILSSTTPIPQKNLLAGDVVSVPNVICAANKEAYSKIITVRFDRRKYKYTIDAVNTWIVTTEDHKLAVNDQILFGDMYGNTMTAYVTQTIDAKTFRIGYSAGATENPTAMFESMGITPPETYMRHYGDYMFTGLRFVTQYDTAIIAVN